MAATEENGQGVKNMQLPVYAFPGTWAPNALLFYTGNQFPEKYKMEHLLLFMVHGTGRQNRKDYNVVFVPFKDGMPVANMKFLPMDFAGKNEIPGGAIHRPCGLAQGPDGSYIFLMM